MVYISDLMQNYFEELEKKVNECYEIANKARGEGKDPELNTEIPKAKDMAARVERIVEIEGIAELIRELLLKKLDRETIAIMVAKEVGQRYKTDPELALNKAVRVGLAILTEGILVAPLEGITGLKLKKNPDNTEYVAIYYSGPIRSAGGTAQALSVLIADIVRRDLNIGRYVPDPKEIERYKEEVNIYSFDEHLQYLPTPKEIEIVVKNCPVCLDGEGTLQREVSGYRNLPRVETNRIRGGMCLVLAEGLLQKSRKLKGVVDKLKIEGWSFLDGIIKSEESSSIEPSTKFIEDILGGRPVFSHPSAVGGFRLRYGRSRTGGLATVSINPASMEVLGGFIAIGTQIKLERPGKAGGVTVCDSIEGPIVLLESGDLIQINTREEAKKYKENIKKIIDVGELLIGYGEFLENNHPLLPGSFSEEWWLEEAKSAGLRDPPKNLEFEEAVEYSRKYDIPLHPKFNLFWHDINVEELFRLREFILKHSNFSEGTLKIPKDQDIKNILVKLGVVHYERDFYLIDVYAKPLVLGLGLELIESKIASNFNYLPENCMDFINKASKIKIYPKAPTRIGARMGRPEKAAERKMNPPVHVLFPLGEAVGNRRSITNAVDNEAITVLEAKVGTRKCPVCGKETVHGVCENCKNQTRYVRADLKKIDINKEWDIAKKNLKINENPEVKGVKGLISNELMPETLEKGMLRAIHDVYVFKDGTCRFDMSNLALTHFKPYEVGLKLSKAYELGYVKDYLGNDLVSEEQVCVIKPQDLIISKKGMEYLKKVGDFIDDLLNRYYHLPKYYYFKSSEDVIGTLVMGLSPHTSGAVLARVIGYTDANACFAHPFYHAAKRRNCDGDEDSVMLMLDGLINFSVHYLPSTRGSMMDAPLLLSLKIDPTEIDKEALNVDIADHYPLEFYRAAQNYRSPKELANKIEIIKDRIEKGSAYEAYSFTHANSSINNGVVESAYKTLGNMNEKTNAQLELASKIRAVDEKDVANRLINSHFIPDIMGNLRKFGTQTFRCSKCNAKYRRIPLNGKCKKCSGNVILTINKGGIGKYLQTTKNIAEKFDVSGYTKQRVSLLESSINSLFVEVEEPEVPGKNLKKLEDFL